MYTTNAFLILLLPVTLLFQPWLAYGQKLSSQSSEDHDSARKSEPSHRIETKPSDVGIYLKSITLDSNDNMWAAGSVWLLQGLLLRHDGERITVETLPNLSTVDDLVFTGGSTGWMLGDYKYVYQTNDAGKTWQPSLKVKTNLTSIVFSDANHGWVAGWHGTIYHTSDGGASWKKQASGTDYDLKKILFVDPLHGWAIGGKSGGYPVDKWTTVLIATGNGGRTWKTISPAPMLSVVAFVNEHRGWGLDRRNNILVTNDSGDTWTIQRPGKEARLSDLFFLNELEGWAVGEEVLHTNDGGKSWSWISEESELPGKLDQVVFISSSRGWGIEEYGSDHSPQILHTLDGGRTWKAAADDWKREVIEQAHRTSVKRKTNGR